jgi:hypothetical protein
LIDADWMMIDDELMLSDTVDDDERPCWTAADDADWMLIGDDDR